MAYRFCLSAALLTLLSFPAWTTAQSPAAPEELSPEELDAAFTEADALREAAGWSDTVIERGPADPLAKMLQAADLVVRGVVTAQEVVYDANDVPFTHTTLTISEVLEGSYEGGMITVVQEGGPTKQQPENVLILSHTHYFTPGQEELMFLQLNPESPYPYSRVLIEKRLSVHNGKVFSENGRGLIYTETDEAPGYRLSWSRDRNPHPRFSEFKIGSHEFRKQFREERAQEGESPGQPSARSQSDARPGYQEGADISTFKNALSGQGG